MSHIAENREDGGRLVRKAHIKWAVKQGYRLSQAKLWEEVSENERERYRVVWDEVVAPYTSAIKQLNLENDRLCKENDRWRNTWLERDLEATE